VYALAALEGAGLVSVGDTFVCVWAQGVDRGLKSITRVAIDIAALPSGRFAIAKRYTNLVEVWDAGTGQRLHKLIKVDATVAELVGLKEEYNELSC
jgi:hypothetical protein